MAEAIVPMLVVRLDSAVQPGLGKVVVELNYKNGAKKNYYEITGRRSNADCG